MRNKRERATTTQCSMRVFVAYNDERVTLDVGENETVRSLKEAVREYFHLGPDEGPSGAEVQEKKILTLNYAGSELQGAWTFSDLAITPSTTIKAILKEEVKPSLYVHCGYNDEVLSLLDKIHFSTMTIGEFRAMVSRKIGFPISVFRLLDRDGREMYDCHTLDEYAVKLGTTIRLETWDGWNEFLNLAIMGFTSEVIASVFNDDVVSRFQLKVALHMAAHFGHVDLAMSLLRMGIRADEQIGEHPLRQWCKGAIMHIENKKSPIHEAAECGQLGVLRAFVNHNIASALAKDGNGLTPLNITLRKKRKSCASFLLTKQWCKMPYTRKQSIGLNVYVKMKRWSDKAKDRVLLTHGQWKSSVKNPRRHLTSGALLGYGVQLDGFTQSKMTSKSSTLVRQEEEHEQRKPPTGSHRDKGNSVSPESYFKSLEAAANSNKLPKLSRFRKTVSKASLLDKIKLVTDADEKATDSAENGYNPKTPSPDNKRKATVSGPETSIKLPPIREKMAKLSKQIPKRGLPGGNKLDLGTEIKSKGMYLKTGNIGVLPLCSSSMYSSQGKQSHSSSSIPESTITSKSATEKEDNKQPQTVVAKIKMDRATKSKLAKGKKGEGGGALQC